MLVDCFAYKKLCVTTSLDGRIKILFVTSDHAMENTIVDEITLGIYFMKALSVAANNF